MQSKDARLNQHNSAGKGFDDLNKVNSIGQNNEYYKDALNWAKQYLGIKE